MIIHKFKGYGQMKKTKDGQYVAIATKKIEIYDSITFEKVATFSNMKEPATISFSSDSRLMAVGNSTGSINLYNLQDMSFIQSFHPSDAEGDNTLFTPDNENLLANDWDGNIYLINIRSGKIETIRQYENFMLSQIDYDERRNKFYMIATQKWADENTKPADDYNILIEWHYPFRTTSLRERKISYKLNHVKYNPIHDGYIAIGDLELLALDNDFEIVRSIPISPSIIYRIDWSDDGKLILLVHGSYVDIMEYETFNLINTFQFDAPLYAEFVKEDNCKTFACGTCGDSYYIDFQNVEESARPIVIKKAGFWRSRWSKYYNP